MGRALMAGWALWLLAIPQVTANQNDVPVDGTFHGRYLPQGLQGMLVTGAAGGRGLGEGQSSWVLGPDRDTVFFRVFPDGDALQGPADLRVARSPRGVLTITGTWRPTGGTGRFAAVTGGEVDIVASGDPRGRVSATLSGEIRY